MITRFTETHFTDSDGNPAGGTTFGQGFSIGWQHGPLGRGLARKEPNGAFVEDIILAAEGRLDFYQNSRFACEANADAIAHLEQAVELLQARTADRETRKVEGLNEE